MKELFNDYVQSLETYIMFRIKQRTAELTPMLKEKGRSPISLSMGAPVQMPPKFALDKLNEAIYKEGMHTYSSPKGEMFLTNAIQERMKKRYGVELEKTEIHSLIGSKEGIANFIRELCNPTTVVENKDIIMVPDPGYASYSQMIEVSGGRAYPIPLTKENNYMPDLDTVYANMEKEGFDSRKVKAVILNYPNNPLGATCTKEYLQKAVDFCKNHKIILMSDAPSIAGTARKKVNSEATLLELPSMIPPRIVEPEREVPGISESAWKQPIKKAFLNETSVSFVTFGRRFLL